VISVPFSRKCKVKNLKSQTAPKVWEPLQAETPVQSQNLKTSKKSLEKNPSNKEERA